MVATLAPPFTPVDEWLPRLREAGFAVVAPQALAALGGIAYQHLLDPRWNEPRGGYEVLVDGGSIKEVSDKPIKSTTARKLDCGKRTLMPGLIDCHVHVFLSEVNIRNLENVPLTLLTARAADRAVKLVKAGTI